MGYLNFQIYWIKIDHFRGLARACESQNVPKRGLKHAHLVDSGFTRKTSIFDFCSDPLEVQPDLGDAGF